MGAAKMADGRIVIKIDMDKSDFENNGDKVIKINVNTNGSDKNEKEPKAAVESEEGGKVAKKKKKKRRKFNWKRFWYWFALAWLFDDD